MQLPGGIRGNPVSDGRRGLICGALCMMGLSDLEYEEPVSFPGRQQKLTDGSPELGGKDFPQGPNQVESQPPSACGSLLLHGIAAATEPQYSHVRSEAKWAISDLLLGNI